MQSNSYWKMDSTCIFLTWEQCLDTAVKVTPFLAKVFRKDKFISLWKISRCLQKRSEEESDCLTAEADSILSHCASASLCKKAVDKFENADRIQWDLGDDSSLVHALCLSKLGCCSGQRKQLIKAATPIGKSIEISEMKPHNKMTNVTRVWF